ncbi:hypothetical protein BK022_03400 [Methylorubrum extorquens]|uniref:Uncharacterized protein n=1 Tax=Methylorubrum extorquens TaxID=408 RepID=A0A1S1P8Y2_METEX|nr:hypothetical protein BK022_03400 [Methylorubrum extorquens]
MKSQIVPFLRSPALARWLNRGARILTHQQIGIVPTGEIQCDAAPIFGIGDAGMIEQSRIRTALGILSLGGDVRIKRTAPIREWIEGEILRHAGTSEVT